MDLVYERTPIGSIVDVVRSVIGAWPPRRGSTWRCRSPPALPDVYIDPGRIKQVLYNLISQRHQVHAARRDGAAERAPGRRTHLVVDRVADTGVGIARDEPAAAVPRVRAARPAERRAPRGDRPRPGAHAAARRAARRRGRGGERARPGLDVLGVAAVAAARGGADDPHRPGARPRRRPRSLAGSETATRTSTRTGRRASSRSCRGSAASSTRAAAVRRAQRRVGVEHDRELVGRARADAPLVGARVRAVRDARRVVRDAARADALARREVAAAVEDDLVAVDRRVRVRAGDRLGVEVERPRHEAADERAARRERAVHTSAAGAPRPTRGWKRRMGNAHGIDGAVPADDVERRVRRTRKPWKAPPRLTTRSRMPSSRGPANDGRRKSRWL